MENIFENVDKVWKYCNWKFDRKVKIRCPKILQIEIDWKKHMMLW